jgi:RNA polymerase sigma factor (sigma-70 family)
MTGSARTALATLLGERYAFLRERLSRRLRSGDRATEALHDTWLRLQRGAELKPVEDPEAYLYRAALNSAAKAAIQDRRFLDAVEIGSALDLADDTPDPERVAIGKSEIAALKRALASLSRRQRDIFMKSYIGDATHAELAERHGVSIRTVQAELRVALLHVAARMIQKDVFIKQDIKVSRNR